MIILKTATGEDTSAAGVRLILSFINADGWEFERVRLGGEFSRKSARK
jgi:hypothetical protein